MTDLSFVNNGLIATAIITPHITGTIKGVTIWKHQVASRSNKPSLTAASIVFWVNSELFIVYPLFLLSLPLCSNLQGMHYKSR